MELGSGETLGMFERPKDAEAIKRKSATAKGKRKSCSKFVKTAPPRQRYVRCMTGY